MKVKRRIEIVTVREQIYQSHQPTPFTPPPPAPHWCNGCQTHTQMFLPDLAATMSGITLRTLFRWIESGHIHFVETTDQVLVCLPSVLANAIQLEREVVFSNGSCPSTTTATNRSG